MSKMTKSTSSLNETIVKIKGYSKKFDINPTIPFIGEFFSCVDNQLRLARFNKNTLIVSEVAVGAVKNIVEENICLADVLFKNSSVISWVDIGSLLKIGILISHYQESPNDDYHTLEKLESSSPLLKYIYAKQKRFKQQFLQRLEGKSSSNSSN